MLVWGRDIRGSAAHPIYWQGTFHLQLEKLNYGSLENIVVNCIFANTSNRSNPLRIYPQSPDSIVFRLIDQKGLVVPQKKTTHSLLHSKNKRYQIIEISSGDTYVKKIDLGGFYDLRADEQYTLQAVFHPYTFSNRRVASQNTVSFTVSKNKANITTDNAAYEEKLFQDAIPDAQEVVELFLLSKMHSDQKKSLKYLDIPRYIASYPAFYQRYNKSSDNAKIDVLYEFVDFLQEGNDPKLKNFHIMSSEQLSLNSEEIIEFREELIAKALVQVQAITEKNGIENQYQYKYILYKRKNLSATGNLQWKIIYVSADYLR